MKPVPVPTAWLLAAAEPWTRFRARQLLGEEGARERAESLRHPLVKQLVAQAGAWPKGTSGDHRSGRDVLNKLTVLADFGVRRGDPGVDAIATRVLAGMDDEGLLRSPVVMPRERTPERLFDVDGQDPLIALAELGFAKDPRLVKAAKAVLRLRKRDGGFVWPDARSPLPCRRDVGGCPYPTVKMLRLFSIVLPEAEARPSLELVLDLWSRRERRYGFGFGGDFAKLKYPFIWFDALHVAEAASRFRAAWSDARFLKLAEAVERKADPEGRFTPESVWMEWKGQCFAQKREPSPWLTVIVHRMLARRRTGV